MGKKALGLGKGLEALIPAAEGEEELREVELEKIRPGAAQTRKKFSEEKIAELAQSIKESGLLQPIVVRETKNGEFEIIAGERRWRACLLAGLKKVNVIVKRYGDREAATASLIENIQREDLNPLEEAEAYQILIKKYGFTQEEISRRVGKSRPFITNTLRLLALPGEVKEMVREGLLSAGHARSLLALQSEEEQVKLAQKVVAKGMSVRETERLVRNLEKKEREDQGDEKSEDMEKLRGEEIVKDELERRLGEIFGVEAKIRYHQAGRGRIIIRFKNRESLERIMERLLGNVSRVTLQ